MLLKTILNRIERHKSFVYGKARVLEEEGELAIEVEVEARVNGRPICSGCGAAGPCYDRMRQPRRFEYVPLWGMAVYLIYRMRRVECPQCGVKVERVPWAEGKSPLPVFYSSADFFVVSRYLMEEKRLWGQMHGATEYGWLLTYCEI